MSNLCPVGNSTCGAYYCRLMAMVVYPEDAWCCHYTERECFGIPLEIIEISHRIPSHNVPVVSVCTGVSCPQSDPESDGTGVSCPQSETEFDEPALSGRRLSLSPGPCDPGPLPGYGRDVSTAPPLSAGTLHTTPDF